MVSVTLIATIFLNMDYVQYIHFTSNFMYVHMKFNVPQQLYIIV